MSQLFSGALCLVGLEHPAYAVPVFEIAEEAKEYFFQGMANGSPFSEFCEERLRFFFCGTFSALIDLFSSMDRDAEPALRYDTIWGEGYQVAQR